MFLVFLFALLFVSSFVPKSHAAECTNEISTSNCRLLMQNGHCLTNDDVKESCQQTCGVCFTQEDEDTLEDARTCRDLSPNCQTYKSRCTQNTYSNQMKRLCPKTCNFDFCRSGTKNSNSKCEDYNKENCRALKDRCTDNADILKEYCPVTCNLCDSTDENSDGDCEDKSDQCSRFKRYCNSQDQEVRQVLREQCASTCNFCDSNSKNSECKDNGQFCMLIKALGPQSYCSSNNNFSTKCPKTCGTCSSNGVSNIDSGPCYDEFTACAQLKQNNLCNKAFVVSEMRKKCRLTCGFCGTNNRLQMKLFGWSNSEPKEDKESIGSSIKGLFGGKKDDDKKSGLFGSLFGGKKDSSDDKDKKSLGDRIKGMLGSKDDKEKKRGLFGSLFGGKKDSSDDKGKKSFGDRIKGMFGGKKDSTDDKEKKSGLFGSLFGGKKDSTTDEKDGKEKKGFGDRIKGMFGGKKDSTTDEKDSKPKKNGFFGSLFGSNDNNEKKNGIFGSLFGGKDSSNEKKSGLFGGMFGGKKDPATDKKSTSSENDKLDKKKSFGDRIKGLFGNKDDQKDDKDKKSFGDRIKGLLGGKKDSAKDKEDSSTDEKDNKKSGFFGSLFGRQKPADDSKTEDSKIKWTEAFNGLLDAYKNSRSGDKSKDCEGTEESGWKDFLNMFGRKPCSNTKNTSNVKNKGWLDLLFGRKEPKSDADKLLEELRKKPNTNTDKTNDDRSLLGRLLGRRKPSSSNIDDLLKQINDGKTTTDDRSLLDRILGRKKPNTNNDKTNDEKKTNPSLEDLLKDAKKKPNSKKKNTADTLLEQLTSKQKKDPKTILDGLRRRQPTNSQTNGNTDLNNLLNFPSNSANNQLGSSSDCFDSQPQACADWVNKGMCSSPTVRQEIKMQYCARSCNLC